MSMTREEFQNYAQAECEKRLRMFLKRGPGLFRSTLSREDLLDQLRLAAETGPWDDMEAALSRCGYLIDHYPRKGWVIRLPHRA